MPTILSIQSHVVHGHVGNASATLPLQLQGWDVLPLNTTQYSNHPGHGQFRGTRASAAEIKDLVDGVVSIDVQLDVVLTGYVPSPEALRTVGDIGVDLSLRQGVTWVMDPVLGDHGRIYVSEENIDIYKELLKTGAVELVTPNQLELEVFSGVKVVDWDSLRKAVETFMRSYLVGNLVVSSVEIPGVDGLVSVCCSRDSANGRFKASYYQVKCLSASFSGSGDLFCALLTSAWFTGGNLVEALGEALSVVEKVLELTYQYEVQGYKDRNEPLPDKLVIHDLKIIKARHFFTQHLQFYEPSVFFDVEI